MINQLGETLRTTDPLSTLTPAPQHPYRTYTQYTTWILTHKVILHPPLPFSLFLHSTHFQTLSILYNSTARHDTCQQILKYVYLKSTLSLNQVDCTQAHPSFF